MSTLKKSNKKKEVKKLYLFGPIEFATGSGQDNWRQRLQAILAGMFNRDFTFTLEYIDPRDVSHKVGTDIGENMQFAARVKTAEQWELFDPFMDSVWKQDIINVDAAHVLVSWVETEDDLVSLCGSVGSFREVQRAQEQGKPVFLISPGPHTKASSHFLHMLRSHGKSHGYPAMVKTPEEFAEALYTWIINSRRMRMFREMQ